MRNYKQITILSTFAKDKLIDEIGGLIREQKGGPAFYLLKALRDRNIDFELVTAPLVEVEILMKKDGEYGRIKQKSKSQKINFSLIKTPLLLISTILDEFNLSGINSFKGKVFLDIQGYVRDGEEFGRKKYWKMSQEITSSIFCLKGTEEEITCLPSSFVEVQKQKILLVTKGRLGCKIYAFGKETVIKPNVVVKTTETIGAGDYFFSSFLIQFMKTKNPLISAKYAIENTSQFLLSKNNHHNLSF